MGRLLGGTLADHRVPDDGVAQSCAALVPPAFWPPVVPTPTACNRSPPTRWEMVVAALRQRQ